MVSIVSLLPHHTSCSAGQLTVCYQLSLTLTGAHRFPVPCARMVRVMPVGATSRRFSLSRRGLLGTLQVRPGAFRPATPWLSVH